MKIFNDYLDWAGGVEKASKALNYTATYLYMVRCGTTPMTRQLAEAIDKHSNGKFSKVAMIWPDELEKNKAT